MSSKRKTYINPFLKIKPSVKFSAEELQINLESAIAYHRQKRFSEAELIYRIILKENPENSDVLNFLGIIANQKGCNEEALELINKAISVRPDVASYYLNRGNILRDLNKLEEAIKNYDQSININDRLSLPTIQLFKNIENDIKSTNIF